ncbi:hypothetical protein LPY66_08670 [Dehalobacter sp. DCM]|uniref:hypothetical protein n=1 Tax=Dehalobacter sp. DCM TaxID=2907827 RepID=UPI003081B157|nr:hypothetical protein LPY66_08670 [Dehalobacter sp. DCM]
MDKKRNKQINYSNVIATIGTSILAITALITVYITVSAWSEEREANRPYFTFKDSPSVELKESPVFEIQFTNVGEHPAVGLWSKSVVFSTDLKEHPITVDEYALVNDIPKNAYATLMISLNGLKNKETVGEIKPHFIVIVLKYEDPIINQRFDQTLYIKWNGVQNGENLATVHAEAYEKTMILEYFKENKISF